jgi:hypothetical protein
MSDDLLSLEAKHLLVAVASGPCKPSTKKTSHLSDGPETPSGQKSLRTLARELAMESESLSDIIKGHNLG